MIWGCPGCWVPPRREGWSASCSAGVEGGDGYACHNQLVTINFRSTEGDFGENFTGLSAKMTWVYFFRVREAQSLCLLYLPLLRC